jgi:hypothetical protein
MKNFNQKRSNLNELLFIILQTGATACFVFVVVITPLLFSKTVGAEEVTSTSTPTMEEAMAIQAAAAKARMEAADALRATLTATALEEEKKLANEQILQQINTLRGMLPNSALDALEKKYQVGAYAPKPPSLITPIASAVQTTATAENTSFVFLKNLKQGDRGEDVRMLQKTLNRSIDTQIASSGAGSPGKETDFFGALTKVAVIRFQNKYAAEILTPNGLTSGTGFVGLSTRAVLNNLTAGKNIPANSLQTKAFFCQPTFTVAHEPGLTPSEVAAIGCSSSFTKEICEKADTYTQSTDALNKDNLPDCRWVSR